MLLRSSLGLHSLLVTVFRARSTTAPAEPPVGFVPEGQTSLLRQTAAAAAMLPQIVGLSEKWCLGKQLGSEQYPPDSEPGVRNDCVTGVGEHAALPKSLLLPLQLCSLRGEQEDCDSNARL